MNGKAGKRILAFVLVTAVFAGQIAYASSGSSAYAAYSGESVSASGKASNSGGSDNSSGSISRAGGGSGSSDTWVTFDPDAAATPTDPATPQGDEDLLPKRFVTALKAGVTDLTRQDDLDSYDNILTSYKMSVTSSTPSGGNVTITVLYGTGANELSLGASSMSFAVYLPPDTVDAWGNNNKNYSFEYDETEKIMWITRTTSEPTGSSEEISFIATLAPNGVTADQTQLGVSSQPHFRLDEDDDTYYPSEKWDAQVTTTITADKFGRNDAMASWGESSAKNVTLAEGDTASATLEYTGIDAKYNTSNLGMVFTESIAFTDTFEVPTNTSGTPLLLFKEGDLNSTSPSLSFNITDETGEGYVKGFTVSYADSSTNTGAELGFTGAGFTINNFKVNYAAILADDPNVDLNNYSIKLAPSTWTGEATSVATFSVNKNSAVFDRTRDTLTVKTTVDVPPVDKEPSISLTKDIYTLNGQATSGSVKATAGDIAEFFLNPGLADATGPLTNVKLTDNGFNTGKLLPVYINTGAYTNAPGVEITVTLYDKDANPIGSIGNIDAAASERVTFSQILDTGKRLSDISSVELTFADAGGEVPKDIGVGTRPTIGFLVQGKVGEVLSITTYDTNRSKFSFSLGASNYEKEASKAIGYYASPSENGGKGKAFKTLTGEQETPPRTIPKTGDVGEFTITMTNPAQLGMSLTDIEIRDYYNANTLDVYPYEDLDSQVGVTTGYATHMWIDDAPLSFDIDSVTKKIDTDTNAPYLHVEFNGTLEPGQTVVLKYYMKVIEGSSGGADDSVIRNSYVGLGNPVGSGGGPGPGPGGGKYQFADGWYQGYTYGSTLYPVADIIKGIAAVNGITYTAGNEIKAGDEITFDITVTNKGSNAVGAAPLEVTSILDELPVGLTPVPATPGGTDYKAEWFLNGSPEGIVDLNDWHTASNYWMAFVPGAKLTQGDIVLTPIALGYNESATLRFTAKVTAAKQGYVNQARAFLTNYPYGVEGHTENSAYIKASMSDSGLYDSKDILKYNGNSASKSYIVNNVNFDVAAGSRLTVGITKSTTSNKAYTLNGDTTTGLYLADAKTAYRRYQVNIHNYSGQDIVLDQLVDYLPEYETIIFDRTIAAYEGLGGENDDTYNTLLYSYPYLPSEWGALPGSVPTPSGNYITGTYKDTGYDSTVEYIPDTSDPTRKYAVIESFPTSRTGGGLSDTYTLPKDSNLRIYYWTEIDVEQMRAHLLSTRSPGNDAVDGNTDMITHRSTNYVAAYFKTADGQSVGIYGGRGSIMQDDGATGTGDWDGKPATALRYQNSSAVSMTLAMPRPYVTIDPMVDEKGTGSFTEYKPGVVLNPTENVGWKIVAGNRSNSSYSILHTPTIVVALPEGFELPDGVDIDQFGKTGGFTAGLYITEPNAGQLKEMSAVKNGTQWILTYEALVDREQGQSYNAFIINSVSPNKVYGNHVAEAYIYPVEREQLFYHNGYKATDPYETFVGYPIRDLNLDPRPEVDALENGVKAEGIVPIYGVVGASSILKVTENSDPSNWIDSHSSKTQVGNRTERAILLSAPDSTFTYEMTFNNNSTSSDYSSYVLINRLPEVGDFTATADNGNYQSTDKARNTEVAAYLTGGSFTMLTGEIGKGLTALTSGYTIEVSTDAHAVYNDDDWAGRAGGNGGWQILNGGIDFKAVRAIRIVFDQNATLKAGHQVVVRFNAQLDQNLPDPGYRGSYLIANDSFGYECVVADASGQTSTGLTQRAEPRLVGVTAHEDIIPSQMRVMKRVAGTADKLPPEATFAFDVAWTEATGSKSQTVTVEFRNLDPQTDFANGYWFAYSEIVTAGEENVTFTVTESNVPATYVSLGIQGQPVNDNGILVFTAENKEFIPPPEESIVQVVKRMKGDPDAAPPAETFTFKVEWQDNGPQATTLTVDFANAVYNNGYWEAFSNTHSVFVDNVSFAVTEINIPDGYVQVSAPRLVSSANNIFIYEAENREDGQSEIQVLKRLLGSPDKRPGSDAVFTFTVAPMKNGKLAENRFTLTVDMGNAVYNTTTGAWEAASGIRTFDIKDLTFVVTETNIPGGYKQVGDIEILRQTGDSIVFVAVNEPKEDDSGEDIDIEIIKNVTYNSNFVSVSGRMFDRVFDFELRGRDADNNLIETRKVSVTVTIAGNGTYSGKTKVTGLRGDLKWSVVELSKDLLLEYHATAIVTQTGILYTITFDNVESGGGGGGGSGGGGGGGGSGGGGGGSGGGTTTVTILDEEIPLAGPEIITILDESIPLANLPQTGGNYLVLLMAFAGLLSLLASTFLCFRRKALKN